MEMRSAKSTGGAEYAEAWLADVADRLEQAKLEALLGIHYDADEFDALVLEFREAKRYVETCRRLDVLIASFSIPGAQATLPGLAA